MNENWMTITNFPAHAVSDLGRVRGPRGLLKQQPRKGYLRVFLYRRGKVKYLSVHRLVLEAFKGPAPPKHEANHINFDTADNRLANLEWVTSKENTGYTVKAGRQVVPGLRGEAHGQAKLSRSDVNEIRRLHANTGIIQTALAERFGVGQASISRLLHGKTWCEVSDD